MPPIPKHADLNPGTPVNVVLKRDQRTNRLTPGLVADVLTKGDHPRGVKVRLADGQVGRVQSVRPGSQEEIVQGWSGGVMGREGGEGMRGGRVQDDVRNDPVPVEERSLEDYIKPVSRNRRKGKAGGGLRAGGDAVGEVGITSGASGDAGEGGDGMDGQGFGEGKGLGEVGGGGEGGMTVQERLEAEFPKVDSALIAAILADHGGEAGEGARGVLRGLS